MAVLFPRRMIAILTARLKHESSHMSIQFDVALGGFSWTQGSRASQNPELDSGIPNWTWAKIDGRCCPPRCLPKDLRRHSSSPLPKLSACHCTDHQMLSLQVLVETSFDLLRLRPLATPFDGPLRIYDWSQYRGTRSIRSPANQIISDPCLSSFSCGCPRFLD